MEALLFVSSRIIQIIWAYRNTLMMKKNDDIKDRLVSISASIVIFAIIVDVMLSMSIDVLEKQLVSIYGVILFIGITAAIYMPTSKQGDQG